MTKKDNTVKIMNDHGPLGFVLFLGYIGAAVYFIHQSNSFGGFLWALVKAIVWPAILVYNALEGFGV